MKLVTVSIVLAGLIAGPALAAPMAGPDVDFFPNQNAADLASDIDANAVGSDSIDLQSISDGDLGTMSGGIGVGDLQINTANNTATSSNNSVSGNSVTGTIQNTQVSNVSGFNTILLNTGNNVTMQSLTQVNIILK